MHEEQKQSNIEAQFSLQNISSSTDWAKYLEELDSFLRAKGFRKYNQNHRSEDFAYWKEYGEKYQIGLLIYDWRKYPKYIFEKKISIAFECMLLEIDGRCVKNTVYEGRNKLI